MFLAGISRKAGWLVATVLAVTGGCACSGADEGATSTASPASRTTDVIRVRANLTLEGFINGQANYDVPYTVPGGLSCSQLAARKSETTQVSFVVPMPKTVGERDTRWTAVVNPYRGPGTYESRFIVPLTLAVDSAKKGPTFAKTAGTKATATIRPDASGSMTFTGIVANGGRTQSGVVRWTCLG